MSKNLINKLQILIDSGELLSIVDNSLSHRQVLAKLGFSDKGQYALIVKKFLIAEEVNTSHFTANGRPKARLVDRVCSCCGTVFTTQDMPSNTQTTCSRACSNTVFRSGEHNGNFVSGHTVYREKALAEYGPVCQRCGYSNILAIEVHHRDKDRSNNNISNLEVLCANCHKIEHNK